MPTFDPSQRRVLELDPARHARVLGAPGTGKSLLAVESFARVSGLPGFADERLLVLAPGGRLPAARLRASLETRLGRALGGTPVRTPASLAFAVIAREFAATGRPAPRLLTGTAHDEAIARAVDRALSEGASALGASAEGAVAEDGSAGRDLTAAFAPEVLASERFRAELREFWRVLDDFDLSPERARDLFVAARDRGGREAQTRAPDPELLLRWESVLGLVAEVRDELSRERPDEFTSSGLLRAATAVLREGGDGETGVPRLVIVDDAQQLGEGELALLAACASRGSRVWAFGDPDVGAGAFQGESTAVLARLGDELARRGARPLPDEGPEQLAVLERVHRHGAEMRDLVSRLTERIGAAGVGGQRAAESAESDRGSGTGQDLPAVRFARAGSPAEQLGVLAHRLRARHLGIGTEGGTGAAEERTPWREMAVVCRSRGEVARAARLLAERQIPTGVSAGGLVLREHRIVRELVALLRHALGIVPLDSARLLEVLGGQIGGLDAVAVRRLRGGLLLQERREAREQERPAFTVDEMLLEGFAFPGERPLIDSAGGRALRRLGLIAAAGRSAREAGGTARETLWAIWQRTGLAELWQDEALGALGARSDSANRALDAVLGLFFRLQRHEEQSSEQPLAELLDEVLATDVPEDTLAARSARDEVTVTTPQGAIGREFAFVCVLGPQDGVWPNLRAQGSLLGVLPLERWLLGGEALQPERRETLHDELRLFALACSRARDELLVLSVADEEHHPGPFFGLGREYEVGDPLPSSRLTLRGAVAEMRCRLTEDPDDAVALRSLALLAAEQVPGAHPDEWYGVLPPSSEAPLIDLDGDPELVVPVSPSQLERAEECPLDWAVQHLGGGAGGISASLGTLVHHALETAESADAEAILAAIAAEWGKLRFDAEWESERTLAAARHMAQGLADYLAAFTAAGGRLLDSEAGFGVTVERAELRGLADRLELRTGSDGRDEISILDLKTGASAPSGPAAEQHPQLQAYQLGLLLGGFAEAVEATGSGSDETPNGGARLLYVHPKATKSRSYLELRQAPLDDAARAAISQRISEIARVMAAGSFTARVEHHCSDGFAPGACRLHIIPPVSRA